MAAIVERPLSLGNGLDPIASQRRAGDVEIIDVDSLDENGTPAARDPQPRLQMRRQSTIGASEPEDIIVLDSDEDDVSTTASATRRASRSRLFSPPPQPHRPSPVPPVPPVPPRYAGHTSFPMRRWSPSVHLPPIRPINRPFDFEANHNARVPGPSASRRPSRRSPPIQASAPSHYAPSMGLGGALMSSYREDQRQANPQPGLLARAGAAASGLANRLSRNLVNIGIGSDTNNFALHFGTHNDDALAQLLVETEMQELFGDLNHRHLLRHLSRDRHPQSATYQAAYTHPREAEPGFTHDFASDSTPTSPQRPKEAAHIIIDDEELGSSSSSSSKQAHWASSPASIKSSNVLVCAKCLDPLVLGAGLVGEEAERRKVWALRCGHMIDGKCLMEIGHPPSDATDEDTVSRIEVKGKGKARASPTKGKGKGKAKAGEDFTSENGMVKIDNGNAAPAPTVSEDNSIRSRLRSSRVSQSASSILESPVPPFASSSTAATRRKRPRKPKIEGEYRYLCPVVGCGCVHVSVKVNDVWRPERDEDRKKPSSRRTIKFPHDLGVDIEGGIDVRGRGAIPVFV
ncbi:hypothetical protein APHAL10511_005011 [Amanita phalloides]|nr:hypothetical protein APHAL10511_005011 [Amanita phalloides]